MFITTTADPYSRPGVLQPLHKHSKQNYLYSTQYIELVCESLTWIRPSIHVAFVKKVLQGMQV